MTDTSTEARRAKPPETTTITVNDQPVVVTEKHMSGAEIKAAAIAAGVPIEPDFVLSEVLPNGKQEPIDDNKKVVIKDGQAFWAIPGDDNS